MSSLLINEHPLIVLPSLAAEVGLPEAIILQQLHYLLGIARNEHEGVRWVYNTQEEWLAQFTWIKTPKTLRRHMSNLKGRGLIRVEKLSRYFGGSRNDQKLYYTVNYQALRALENRLKSRMGQCDPLEPVDMTPDAQRTGNTSTGRCAPLEQVNMTPDNQNPDEISFGQSDSMGGACRPVASGQHDPKHSVKVTLSGTGQHDRMLHETTQENTTEITPRDVDRERGSGSLLGSSYGSEDQTGLFAVESDHGRCFPMVLNWLPTSRFEELCQARGVYLGMMSASERDDLLAEFRCYWASQPGAVNTQGQWEYKLVQRCKLMQSQHAGTGQQRVSKGPDWDDLSWGDNLGEIL